MGADDRESERRQIDPGLVAQHYECNEDDGETENVAELRQVAGGKLWSPSECAGSVLSLKHRLCESTRLFKSAPRLVL